MATDDKSNVLFTLGEVDRGGQWHDYLQYGFSEDDVSVLLELAADDELTTDNNTFPQYKFPNNNE